MITSLPSRFAGWFSAACALVATAAPSIVYAQAATTKLAPVVVSASRTPQDAATTPSSVTLLPLSDLDSAQIPDLRTALAEVPGVYIANSGAVGSQGSVFMRGASSHQVLFVVDGVRMNDRSTGYQNFLGGADLVGLERIEVLRGPQGTLYGSSAMGGVILMETAKGCGDATGALSVSAGSFNSYGASAAVKGGTTTLGYSASLVRSSTDNDRAFNQYKQWSYSTRVESLLTSDVLVGATYRGQLGDHQEPGSTLYFAQGAVDADNHLVTAYARVQPFAGFNSRLTTAYHHRAYTYATPYYSAASRNTRKVADWQNSWTASEQLELVAGANVESSEFKIDGTKTSDRISAAYLSATAKPVAGIILTGALRYDDYRSVGSATTWRTGASYVIAPTKTTLRATYGTGFTAPGSDDRYGVPSWGVVANPTLQAEKSTGWDFGFDQAFLEGKLNFGVTYFQNKYRNLFEWETINWTTYEGRTTNRTRATTRGLEVAFDGRINHTLSSRVAYTYLEASNDLSHVRLVRRPRHVGDAELKVNVSKTWLLGTGLHVVADRIEGSTALEDYTTVRLFTSYELAKGLRLKLRVENVLDEKYQEILGYPALPLGVYGSLEWRF